MTSVVRLPGVPLAPSPPSVEPDPLDPISFRVPASDAKGHTSRLWFRSQPGHANQLEIVLRSRHFPYRTKGDILRHALVRHLQWLEDQHSIPSVTAEVDAIIDIMRDEEFNADFITVFEKMNSVIAGHLGHNALGEAARLVLSVQSRINQMPEGYWRNRYTTELQQRYGHIVANAPKASLSTLSAEED